MFVKEDKVYQALTKANDTYGLIHKIYKEDRTNPKLIELEQISHDLLDMMCDIYGER